MRKHGVLQYVCVHFLKLILSLYSISVISYVDFWMAIVGVTNEPIY